MDPGMEGEAKQGLAASSPDSIPVSEYGKDMAPQVAGYATPSSNTQTTGDTAAVPSNDIPTDDHGEDCTAVVGVSRLDAHTGDEEQNDVDYSKMLADYLDSIALQPVSDNAYTVYPGEPFGLPTAVDADDNSPPMNESTAAQAQGYFLGKPNDQKQEEHSSVAQKTSVLAQKPSEPPVVQSQVVSEPGTLVPDTGSAPTASVASPMPSSSRPVAPTVTVLSVPKRCTRNGCTNPAVESRDWDKEYCSSECVIAHCKAVFKAWVSRRQVVATAKPTH